MDEEIKRWTARRKAALVLEIVQGKTTVAEASRQFDLQPSEIEEWIDQGKAGMENALRAKPEDVREQYERQLKDLREAYGEAMLELRARKKLASLLVKDETCDHDPAGTAGGRHRGIDGQAVPVAWRGTTFGVLPADQDAAAGERGVGHTDQGVD